MIEKRELWDAAGKAGIVLGAVSSAYLFLTQWLAGALASKGGLLSAVTMILWIAKFAGCIFLMKFFLRKFADSCTGAGTADLKRLGTRIAFLSALIYSALYLVDNLYIAPELISDSIDTVTEQMGSLMDSNTEEALESLKDRIPFIGFFSNLIYCTLFGMVVSSIQAPRIINPDPFYGVSNEGEDNKNDE